MNPFSIFTNKNDLVKVLAIGGLLVLIFSLIYPIEKTKELDLRKVELNSKIRDLNSKVKESSTFLKRLESEQKLSDSEKDAYKTQSRKLKSELNSKKNSVNSLEDEITVLNNYINQYQGYTSLFFWTGLISSIMGVLFWAISGYKEFERKNRSASSTNSP